MKFPIGRGTTAVLLGITLLLVACTSGDPSPPAFDAALSNPVNLEIFTYAGGDTLGGSASSSAASGSAAATAASAASTGPYYVHYDKATSETLASNPDLLGGVTLDTSGATGALSITAPVSQIPGIYYLGIYAQNTNGTVTDTVVVNVLPPQANGYAIVDVPLYGNTIFRNTDILLFGARNEVLSSSGVDLVLPDGITSAGVDGVYVNGISTALNTGTGNYAVTADITVDMSILGSLLQPETGTDKYGQTVTVSCLPLEFQASPSSNGSVMSPYAENVCLHPI